MNKRYQLFVLPFAGGNSMSFRTLKQFLDPRIEMITIEYAGRLTRKNEKYIEDYSTFLEDVLTHIEAKRDPDAPYALFGYSLGSALIYDLLAHGKVKTIPERVFLCAKGSALTKNHREDHKPYSKDAFLKEIVSLGGIDERIAKNERFLSIYMEPVRKDFIIWEQFVYEPGMIPCNVTVIYGKDDPETADVTDWAKLSEGTVDFYAMSGTHFFINRHWEDVAKIINGQLVGGPQPK